MGCLASKAAEEKGVLESDLAAANPAAANGATDPAARAKADKHAKEVVASLLKCEPFKDEQAAELNKVAHLFKREEFGENRIINQEGEVGDRMYVMVDGHAVVTAKDERGFHTELRRYIAGDVFSEVSLFFDNHKHGTTVSTLASCVLYSLAHSDLAQFKKGAPKTAKHLEQRARAREMMTQTLENIPAFKTMRRQKRYILLELCTMRRYRKNENIVEQGTESKKRFFMIAEGDLNVYLGSSLVRVLRPKDYFGDVSLVSDKPHSATVQVSDKSDAILLELPKDDFIVLMSGEDGVLAEFGLKVAGTHSNLVDVLQHPTGREYLTKYVAKEFAKENIDFWHAVDLLEATQKSLIRKKVLKSLGVSPDSVLRKKAAILETKAKEIFDLYLAESAQFQVNIKHSVFEPIKARMEKGDYDFQMFHEAKQEVFELLKDDKFDRFLQSPEFGQLLKQVGAYELNQKTLPRKKREPTNL